MNRLFYLVVFFAIVQISFCQTFAVQGSDEYGISFRFSIDNIDIAAKGDFSTLSIDDYGYSKRIGTPKLPVLRKFIRIPMDGNATVSVDVDLVEHLSLSASGYSEKIFPRQRPREKNSHRADFVIDENWYADSSLAISYNEAVKVIPVGIIRGRRIALLEISPIVQYEPRTGDVEYISDASVRVSFDTPLEQVDERFHSAVFDQLLARVLPVMTDIPPSPEPPIVYWVIYGDDFSDDIAPLLDWKSQMGYDVIATPISEIGATVDDIKDTVQSAYDGWEHPPDFVLLVGDVEQIPAEDIPYGWWGSHPSDLYYFTTDGDDFLPDILHGRFPCATGEQVRALVQKTIEHEKYLMTDTDYLETPLFIACGTDGDYELAESTHRYVFQTWTTPPEFQPESLWAYDGATASDVISAINAGTFIIDYSGHGSETGWANPGVSSSDIPTLTNSGMYPLVISNACLTAKYDEPECFGEAWVRAADKGAVTFIGGSNSTLWDEDDILERRWFDAVFVDSFTSVSGALYKAKLELMLYGTSSDTYYFQIYQDFGDPSLALYWGDLTAIDVDLSEWSGYLPLGEDYYDISTSEDNALVALWRDGEKIGAALSTGGIAHIVPDTSFAEPGSAYVVATKANFFQPFIRLVPNEFLCTAEYSPDSLQVGIDNTFEITITGADTSPYVDALVKIAGYGVAESTFTDASGYASMTINPPYEGILELTVQDSTGRRVLRKDIPCYGALPWAITARTAGVSLILLDDTLAVGFSGNLNYHLSASDFICYVSGGGLPDDTITVSDDSIALTFEPTAETPIAITFAKAGYLILSDTIPVVIARGPFCGTVVDTVGAAISVRPYITLLDGDDTISTVRAELDGSFSIPGTFLCDSYTVNLSGFGYYDTSYTFLLTTRGGYEFTMTPTPSSAITINVRDDESNPLTAEMYLVDSLSGEIVSAGEMVAPGQYSLGNQPYREYNLIVRSRGYKPQRLSFYATGAIITIDVTMPANLADILIIDVSSDGVSPAQIQSDLEDAGFSTQIVTTFPDSSEMWDYNMVIYSAGTNSFSATSSILDALYQFHKSGGRIAFEGGEVAYQVIEDGGFLPIYTTGLLHLSSYLSDDPHDAGLISAPLFRDSLIYSYPAFLDENIATEHVSFYDYEKFDVVTPAEDAQFFYTTVDDTTQGCIVLFKDSERRGFARSAFCGFSYTEALTDADDAADLMKNICESLLPPNPDAGVVFGNVTLAGGFIGSNVEIDADGIVPAVDSTNSDGRFAMALKPGDYSLTFHRTDYRDTSVSVTIDPENTVRMDMILTPLGVVHERKPNIPFIGNPVPNPFNSSVSIEYTNPAGDAVIAEVRDILGKIVFSQNLKNERTGTFIWRPDESTSGIYFVKISVGNFSAIKKVAYIR